MSIENINALLTDAERVLDPSDPEDLSILRSLPDGAVLVDAERSPITKQVPRAWQITRYNVACRCRRRPIQYIAAAGSDWTIDAARWGEELQPLRLVFLPEGV